MFVLLDKQMCIWCIWENKSGIYCDKLVELELEIYFSLFILAVDLINY